MMQDLLISYGPLGAWTLWLLYEKQKLLSKFSTALEENTKLLRQMINKLK